MKKCIVVLGLIVCLMLSGCSSTVTAVKLTEDGEKGIPYYLPKPYLMITRNLGSIKPVTTKTVEEKIDGAKKTTKTETKTEYKRVAGDGDNVFFQIIYLPDLAEKYGIRMKSGSGTLETDISLEDGWNLTGINMKADTKTAETLQGIGSIVEGVGGAISAAMPGVGPTGTTPKKVEVRLYEIKLVNGQMRISENKPVFVWPPRPPETDGGK